MDAFFRESRGRFRGCDFLHCYRIRAGLIIIGAECVCLAIEHPNLVATKLG